MEFLPLLPFMAISTPESFVLYYMGNTVFGYRTSFVRLAAVAVVTSLTSYLIRSMPILFGIHTLVQTVVMIAGYILVFRMPVSLAVVTTLISGFLLGLTESILIPFFGWIFGFSIKEIISDSLLRFLFGMPYFILLAGITYAVSRKGWHLDSLRTILTGEKNNTPGRTRQYYLFAITILQALILIFLNLNFYIYQAKVFPTFRLSQLILFTSIIIIATAIITVFVANRLVLITNREVKLEADLNHLREMQSLNLQMRSQKHDFYNHITSLYGFIRSGRFEDARHYMESLYQDIKKVKELLEIDPPALGALLSLKRDKADNQRVKFSWEIELDKNDIPFSIQELTQVLGNLLDNAIEAAGNSEPGIVRLNMSGIHLGLEINVSNTSRPVHKEILKNIFQPGVSTKNTDEHSGLGLFIVKQIVNRHNGQIEVNEPDDFPGLEIQVFIPRK